jgi:hypothetical protein
MLASTEAVHPRASAPETAPRAQGATPGTAPLPAQLPTDWEAGPTPRHSSASGHVYYDEQGLPARFEPRPRPTPATSSSWAAIIGLALVLSVIAVGGAAAYFGLDFRSKAAHPPLKLDARERLFIDGVLADPTSLRPGSPTGLLAIAQGGRLVRYGVPSGDSALDARSLRPVGADLDLSPQVTVRGLSNTSGCSISAGEQPPIPLPGSLTIPAGVEVRASISCPGRADWKTTLLGIPGQRIELRAP